MLRWREKPWGVLIGKTDYGVMGTASDPVASENRAKVMAALKQILAHDLVVHMFHMSDTAQHVSNFTVPQISRCHKSHNICQLGFTGTGVDLETFCQK